MEIFQEKRATLSVYAPDDVRALLSQDHEVVLDIARQLADSDAPRAARPSRASFVRSCWRTRALKRPPCINR